MIGRRLGPYEITAKLGEGGMGEVYRAHDTKLKRDVAIKVLPAAFTEDRERLARFEREAQLLAQLHHPNIASIFGLEESGGMRALIMELVEGPTLAERLEPGPLPLNESLSVSLQIAQALEEAHEKGIVHRDLKPQNIKASIEGKVKVLDFGLAKAMDPIGAASGGSGSASQLAQSPTLTLGATVQGMILGTAAYMAPEQAKGLPIDRRADIWAFGVVLYEMLTGRSPFASDSVAETLAGVLKSEIDLSVLPPETPASIRALLARCLERNPKNRLRDIGEARLALGRWETEIQDAVAPRPNVPESTIPPARRGVPVPVAIVLALAVGAVAALVGRTGRTAPVESTTHLSIALPPGDQVTTAPAISPDGRTIAFAAGRSSASSRLYVRRLEESSSRAVDSGAGASWPFFSPDGRSIAFFAGGRLWRVPVDGGAAIAIATAPRAFGGTWGADDRIVFVPTLNAGLWRVASAGGAAERMTQPDSGENGYAHVFPQALATGEILYTQWGKSFHAVLLNPSTGLRRAVTGDAKRGGATRYLESGYLVRGDVTANLLAARWRPSDTVEVLPQSVVLERVNWIAGTDQTWFAASANGTVVLAPGTPDRRHLVWVDRSGAVTEISPEPDLINGTTLSPDGRYVAYNGRSALWVRDLSTGARTRVLSEVSWTWPGGWIPGTDRFATSSNQSGDWEIYSMRAGGGALEPLLKRASTQHPMDFAPDGTMIFLDYDAKTGVDLWTLTPGGEAKPLVASPFQEWGARVSPDGSRVAYVSDEDGRQEVYAISTDGTGARTQVSLEGGTGPVWSRDGRELFYRAGDDLIAVEVRSTNPLALGERKRLFDVSALEPQYFHEFDVAPDGRFLFLRAEPDSRPTRLDVILDWFPELERKMGAR